MNTDWHIPRRLVDSKVQSFGDWRLELHEEDIEEFGHRVVRPLQALFDLYDIYKEIQSSPEYCKIRESL